MDSANEGTWEEYSNIDMCGQGDVEIIPDWKKKYTVDDLKRMVINMGYSCFTVSAGEPSFGHAALKKFDHQITKETCKGIDTCCKHPCTIRIYTKSAASEEPKPAPAGTWESFENLDMCSKGDTSLVLEWKKYHTLESLKQIVAERGYTAIAVGEFGHAALKMFPFALKKEHLRPTDYQCTMHVFTPEGGQVEKPFPGTWESHDDMDICGHLKGRIIDDWRKSYTMDEMKWICAEQGFTSLTVLKDHPQAYLRVADIQISKEHLSPISGPFQYPCETHIFTRNEPFVGGEEE